MADNGKLWFEMGVRENVTRTLTDILKKGAEVAEIMDGLTKAERKVYDNASRIEQAYDKIGVALRRINDARGRARNGDDVKKLNEMESNLRKMQQAFEAIEKNEALMGTKGYVALQQLKEGFQLAMNQVLRFTGEVESASRAEERQAAASLRDADKLKSKWYELVNLRKRLSDSILSAGSGVDTSMASNLAGKLWNMEMRVSKLLASGGSIPVNFFGADYQELIRQSKEAARVLDRETSVAERNAAQAVREHAQANQGLLSSYDKVLSAQAKQNRLLNDMVNYVGTFAGFYGLKSILKDVITIGGQFEVQHVALQNILGDIQEADALFGQLKSLAIESPKTFQQLASYTKQLAAYSIPENELFDTTKRLADLSTGLGVDMNRLILAYGQVRSAAVLRGQELRQFTEAGIPLVQRLADKFTELNGKATTTGDVFELISKRAVSFEMVRDILWEMTDEGGQFYNMQAKIADTLYGKWQKLTDAWKIMLGEFADSKSVTGGTLKWLLEMSVGLVKTLSNASGLLTGMAVAFAGRRLIGFGKSMLHAGMDSVNKDFLTAKADYAREIAQKRYLQGEASLSAREKEILATKRQITAEDYKLLAASGRLSTVQLGYLYKTKQINADLLAQLRTEQLITEEEYKRIRFGSTFGERMKGFGVGMLKSPMLWMTAFSAAFAIVGEVIQKTREINQSVDTSLSTMRDRYNDLWKTIESIDEAGKGATDDKLDAQIKQMEDALKSAMPYFNGELRFGDAKSVREEADAISDLGERYDFLRGKLESAALAYREMEQNRETMNNVLREVGGMWSTLRNFFGGDWDSLEEDLGDWEQRHAELQNAAGDVMKYEAVVREAMKKIAPDIYSAQKPMSELLKLLSDEGLGPADRFAKVMNAVSESSRGGTYAMLGYRDALLKSHIAWNDIDEDVQKFTERFMLNKSSEGWKFDNLSKEQEEEVKAFVHTVVQQFQEGGEEIKRKVESALLEAILKVKVTVDIDADAAMTELNNFANRLWLQLGGDPSDKRSDATVTIGGKTVTRKQFNDEYPSNETARKRQQEKIKAAKEALDAAKTIKDATHRAVAEAAATRDLESAMAWWFPWSDDPLKNGKSGGGSKKDTALDAARTRLDEVKRFYSEWKKYREVYGESEAVSILKETFGISLADANDIVYNYRVTLEKIIADIERGPMTEQRKKFVLSVRQLLGDFDLDNTKRELDKELVELQQWMRERLEEWNVYKGLRDKTGDEDFARIAFGGGRLFDEQANELVGRLRDMGYDSRELASMWDMSDAKAKEFFNDAKDGYELWKQIVTLTRKNWLDGLNAIGDATSKLLSTEEKLAKVEAEIGRLRSAGAGGNDPRVLLKERELRKLEDSVFEESTPYLRFYSAIFDMTIDEAERAGATIKEHLVKSLADGSINADKYLKSLKNVDQQLEKLRGRHGTLLTLLSGGLKGYLSERSNRAESSVSSAAIDVELREREVLRLRKALYAVSESGDEKAILAARMRLTASETDLELSKRRLEERRNLLGISNAQLESMNSVLSVVETISGAIDGLQDGAQQLSDMLKALGHENSSNTWSDIAETIGAIGSPLKYGKNAMSSAMSGDAGGVISNVVGMFTGPITAFAKLHDKKLQREIELSERAVSSLRSAYSDLSAAIEKSLGGIYRVGGYDEMLENLRLQRDELQRQYNLEGDKKDSDADKLRDLQQQLKETDDAIKTYALDVAKTLYDIDLGSWAKTLTDSIVGAWEKGEDAVLAYRDCVKDIIKDLTTNILTKKVMERAFSDLHIDDLISELMGESSGQLDPVSAAQRLASALTAAGEQTAGVMTNVLDALERAGSISKGDSSGSSAGSSIKSISEQQASILLGYINAIRADMSVEVANFRLFLDGVMPGVSNTLSLQLASLNDIKANTGANARATEAILDLLDKVKSGTVKLNVKTF